MKKHDDAVAAAIASKNWLDNLYANTSDSDLTMEQKAVALTHKRIVERGNGFTKRMVVHQFLNDNFQFNPDKHVRSAYSNNPLDPERVMPAQLVKTKTKTKTIIGKSGAKLTIDKKTNDRSNNPSVKHIPPMDVFHRWTYYTDSNYEEIRTAVQDLYADKPDLEFAINPYSQFESAEDAEKFVRKHSDEVIADVVTLNNSSWNLLGSFKKNRERINFYNNNTAVVEEIFKQMEADKKLGADLMRKRVRRKKKKNIEEVGADPKEFKRI